MITPFIVAVLGATVFIEQEVPGLRVGGVAPLSGRPTLNFRQADIDGDGWIDLVLPDKVFFQREGRFPKNEARALPRIGESPACDLFKGAIYLAMPNRVEAYRWEGGAWSLILAHKVVWPGGKPPGGRRTLPSKEPRVRFARFLHDLDGEGPPEIIVPYVDGIHVFRQIGNRYKEDGLLNVLPPLSPARTLGRAIWPAEARRLEFPPRRMACQTVFDGNTITVITRHALPNGMIRYRSTVHQVTAGEDGFSIDLPAAQVTETEPMASYLDPCRLNEDDTLDFAGGDWSLSAASVLPTPIFVTTATLDGGRTVQTLRTNSFRPRCSFVDFDGDGDLDMVTESTGLLEGGLRETISRFLSQQSLHHEIRVYFQDGRNRFSKTPSLQHRFTIHLAEAPYRNGALFRRYQAGELLDVTGDFNGDGYRDVLVQQRPGELGIFLCQQNRFSRKPDIRLSIQKNARFAVADIDGDGRSDIAVRWKDLQEDGGRETGRIYFSREGE